MTQYNNLLIEDIFLSGFVEREGEISVFKPMFWWCFLKLDNGKIIEISSNDGNIKLVETPKINCNFDLDCEPDYLFGHLANIEIDEDNEILMSGING